MRTYTKKVPPKVPSKSPPGTIPLSEKNTFSSVFLPKGKQILLSGRGVLPLGKEFLPLGKMQKKQPLSGNVPGCRLLSAWLARKSARNGRNGHPGSQKTFSHQI